MCESVVLIEPNGIETHGAPCARPDAGTVLIEPNGIETRAQGRSGRERAGLNRT